MCKKHEFNNGFVSAIALFYGHQSQFEEASKIVGHDMRLYAAADHLYGLNVPTRKWIGPKLRRRIMRWRADVMYNRLNNISREEGQKFFDEAKEILLSIDRSSGMKHVCANYG